MTSTLTLVAAAALSDDQFAAFSALSGAGEAVRLGARAIDIAFSDAPDGAEIAALAGERKLDFAIHSGGPRERKLLVADMDSTIIEQECIDELADLAGVGPEVSAVTERAMRGELDFEGALIERVARLKGQPVGVIDEVLGTRLTLSPGARTMVQTMNARGARTVLVSGGFECFVSEIAERCGFAAHFANRLGIDTASCLSGQVIPPILGREAKKERLELEAKDLGIGGDAALAIGDGANDLGMIGAAGLGIAYKAKPIVAEAADAAIRHTDLTAALYYQGIREDEFAA